MADRHQGGLGGMGDRATEEMAMSMMMQTLRGLKYPPGKTDLAREVQQRNAPGQVTGVLDRMPARQFTSAGVGSVEDLLGAGGV